MTRLPYLLLALLALPNAAWGQDLENLLRRMPAGINAIAVFNVDAAYKSPMGVKENWAKRQAEVSGAGTADFPQSVKLAVLGTIWSPGNGNSWTAGLATTNVDVTVQSLIDRERGREETINGMKVCLSPRNAFFFALEPRLVGMMSPANRLEAARWLRTASQPSGKVTDYLAKATALAKQADIVMAVDFADVTDVNNIRLRLSDSASMTGSKVDLDALAKFLSTVEGLTFTVKMGEQMTGELQVDFKESVQPYAMVVKPLLIEVLEKLGLAIDGMKDWTLSTGDKSFKLNSRLNEQELRQIVSLIQLPVPAIPSPGAAPNAAPPAAPTPLEASQKYFREVTRLIEDLRRLRDRARTHNQNATWHDQYARKVDQLPIMNVDPDLLAWGSSVANRFRALAASLRGVQLQANVLNQQRQSVFWEQAPSWGWNGGWGFGGWMGGTYFQPGSTWTQNNYRQVNAARVELAAQGVKDRSEVWNTIDSDTNEIRRLMLMRHNVDFTSQVTAPRPN